MKSIEGVPETPILIVRWIHGKNEKDEIAATRKILGGGGAVWTVRATYKEQIYESFESWLKTPDPQILYIGAHGCKHGLTDGRELITWEQLGRHLGLVAEVFKHSVDLVLGACHSSLAPAIWTRLKLRVPVSRVFCLDEEPYDHDVVDLIVEILAKYKEQKRLIIEEGRLTYFDEDLVELRAVLPSRLKLRVFLRGEQGNKYAFVEIPDLGDQSKVQKFLEGRRNRRKTSELESALRDGLACDVPSNSDLQRIKAQAKRLNQIALDDKDGALPVRPLPRQGRRDQLKDKRAGKQKS